MPSYLRIVISACALSFFIARGMPAFADDQTGEATDSIVKLRVFVPPDASSASSLGAEREGTGVLIDSSGLILTIGYLILEAETIGVIDSHGGFSAADFVAYDVSTGFGLVRSREHLSAAPMELGDSSSLQIGDTLHVIGFGDDPQPVRIILKGEFAGYWEYLLDNAIYAAPAYPAFGGAALVSGGKLVGIGSIFTILAVPTVGGVPCNMFVPIELLKPILKSLISDGRSAESVRPWLGITLAESQGRVLIREVSPQGPADAAGMRAGDILLAVEDKQVEGLADFYRKVWAAGRPGATIHISVLHDMSVQVVDVHSVDRYQFLKLPSRMKPVPITGKLTRDVASLH